MTLQLQLIRKIHLNIKLTSPLVTTGSEMLNYDILIYPPISIDMPHLNMLMLVIGN